jgi:type II secretory pathway component PulF
VPVVTLLLLAAWCLACTRAAMLHAAWANWLLGRLPWVGQLLQWTRTATFLELFALLIEHETPLDEAATLAAYASGDRQTRQMAAQLVDSLARGQLPPEKIGTGSEPTHADIAKTASGEVPVPIFSSGFPPLVAWILHSAGRTGALLPALKHAAATYHRRARHQADVVYSLLPPLLTLTISGSLAVAYALMLFVPYTMMLRALAR